jgi:hypothetical protein
VKQRFSLVESALMHNHWLETMELGYNSIMVLAVSIRQHTSAYVSIRQHTSAYVCCWLETMELGYNSIMVLAVSIRQHTSAYVSIRQHTSAYVSIRQHSYAAG